MDSRNLILHCTRVNMDYMKLPAGRVKGFEKLVELYRRLAYQSMICATAWKKHLDCPPHEPAVDAFWWASVSWAISFGESLGVDRKEWYDTFVCPHLEFSLYLRPDYTPPPWRPMESCFHNRDIIIHHDIEWTRMVIGLTVKWGLCHHLRRDIDVLIQARKLIRQLNTHHSLTRQSYIESDIAFFRQMFQVFPFKKRTRNQIILFLNEVEDVLRRTQFTSR